MSGELFIVATPIGNLGDITIRALEALKNCDLVAAEDTRAARKLCQRYQFKPALTSLHEHSSRSQLEKIIARLQNGERVCLIAEAGTPGISDPGYQLIQLAVTAAVRVTPLPGACAAITALSASALPLNEFYFAGFPPTRDGALRRRFEQLRQLSATLVFYESPRRLQATLAVALAVFGDRPACVARELTKLHEELLRDSLSRLLASGEEKDWRGEITLLVAGIDKKAELQDPQRQVVEEERLGEWLRQYDFRSGKLSRRDLTARLQEDFPLLPRRRIYELVNRYAHSE